MGACVYGCMGVCVYVDALALALTFPPEVVVNAVSVAALLCTVDTMQWCKTLTKLPVSLTRALNTASAALGAKCLPPTLVKNSAAMPPEGWPSVHPSPPDTIPPK